jgi:hypothetical protein
MLRAFFRGSNGLRPGWRLLIFFAILIPIGYVANRIVDLSLTKFRLDFYTPVGRARPGSLALRSDRKPVGSIW